MDNFQKKFIEEATDLINDLEQALLSLEKQPKDTEIVASVFRIMHSLKGGGGMFGFDEISNFTHNLETIYDEIRNGNLLVTEELLSITFSSVDHLRNLLDPEALKNEQISKNHNILLSKVEGILKKHDKKIIETQIPETEKEESVQTFYIYFGPNESIMDNGTNPLYLLDELNTIGNCNVYTRTQKIPLLSKFNFSKCYTSWEVFLVTKEPVASIQDVFIFVEDESELEISNIANFDILSESEILDKIEDLFDEKSHFDLSILSPFINNYEKEKKNKIDTVTEKLSTFTKENVISSIRVSSDKIDELMNLVSELVTSQASLSLFVEENKVQELNQLAENIENITRQLRDTAFNISLIPIETMLTRFHRLIRDLSTEFGKNIDFITEGAETELDKTLIQGLTDPLMHIIRNSVDHGIESEKERVKLGKTLKGMIYLKAYYSGANVVIKIQDDGKGIDLAKVRQKAISKELIQHDSKLTERELLDIIFLPGFSTAENVTDVSGRGVGMDVVKRKIEEIRGTVELDSKTNVGTTITIKLPLTLSIIDGLLVMIGNTKYVMPLNLVNKIYAVNHQDFKKAYNNIIIIDGEQIPFYYLRDEFEIDTEPLEVEQMVIVKYEDKKIGLAVDDVIGEYQAVLKPLGKLYKNHEIISGATILGDGTIALVLDTNKIIHEFSFKN
ncbi:MAG: chemotaxis protein CheA [Bacteroidales bacterium]|nr:chemotaxis protein CheA [Bacteroidales bacterium]MBN2758093.1 chemotaxis protein CheA [Bacteroidales bacterium]